MFIEYDGVRRAFIWWSFCLASQWIQRRPCATTAWQLIRVALFVSDSVLSFILYLALPRKVRSSFSRVFCLTSPHMLLSELALVKLEILKRSVIENWPLKVLTKYICSLKNNRTENVRGQFVDFVRKKRENREEGKQAGWTGINGSLLS